MRGREAPEDRRIVCKKGVEGGEEVREAHLGEIRPVQVVKRFRFGRRRLKRVVG
jgi:hypothetical protein